LNGAGVAVNSGQARSQGPKKEKDVVASAVSGGEAGVEGKEQPHLSRKEREREREKRRKEKDELISKAGAGAAGSGTGPAVLPVPVILTREARPKILARPAGPAESPVSGPVGPGLLNVSMADGAVVDGGGETRGGGRGGRRGRGGRGRGRGGG